VTPQRARSLRYLVLTLSQVARTLRAFHLVNESQAAEKLKRDLENILPEEKDAGLRPS
jgi:hypothetical protein